ncbi:hypothetical protein DFO47_102158 [Arthrobacter sp. AG258]|uniref:hypothetical protein n=1 Tax=Arthrobacter sp. AG258 TaxID=2183899 RepID=UPI001061A4D6|nr:hypothetical protein [Arthrobacter sp. AG258]TDT82235.1 hypothetical protein DFO47_102158 [Arthrobacter sp. AG258]
METAAGSDPNFSRVGAIALDTNIFAEAPGMETLRSLCSRADKHGRIEIWVTDTVIWEWGQHLHGHHVSLRAATKKLHSAGFSVEVPDEKTAKDIALDLSGVITSLGSSIRVLSTADFAHEALRDQILLEGPAKRKSEVKTGAADSAHLRAYIHEGRSRDLEYVVVSADKDTRTAYQQWLGTEGPHIFSDLRRATEKIFGSVPSDADGLSLALRLAYEGNVLLRDVTISEGNMGDWEDLVPDDISSLSFDVDAASAKLVGLNHTKQDATALTFTAFYLAEVRIAGLLESPWSRGSTRTREATVPRALLRADISLPAGSTSAEDALVTNCYVDAGGSGWREQSDALDNVMDALTLVPGITVELDGLASWPEQRRSQSSNLLVDVAGVPLDLTLYGSYFGNWELTASYGERKVMLKCDDLGVGFTDPEGDGIPEYYDITAFGSEAWSGNAEFAINEMLFEARRAELTGSANDTEEESPQ